jgi:phosphopantothenoylcysteine decarboxylase / phosphopantothenate---cysteine ligase
VSGGIAAYKACELVRWLQQRGASTIVAMTAAAAEFVTPLTFQALSGNPVVRGLWGDQAPRFRVAARGGRKPRGRVEHVDVAEAADLIVIAPATADLIARLVHGEAPDALTSIALASRAPLIVCPAMDREMWRHAATQENLKSLRRRGAIIVGPERGALASGLEGPGRLAAIDAIGAAIESALVTRTSLAGVHILIGAGRTEEPLDPVRVLTNRSSGRMGVALAEAARDRGATVTLVAGPMSVDAPDGVSVTPVTTAAEMASAMKAAARTAHVVVMAAAVADFRPRRVASEKLKRAAGPLALELEPNPDVLAGLTAARRAGQRFVGFALETSRGLARARAKLRAKRLDLIVLNSPREGLGGDTNRVTLVDARGAERLPTLSKREVAERVWDRVTRRASPRPRRPRAVAASAGSTTRRMSRRMSRRATGRPRRARAVAASAGRRA